MASPRSAALVKQQLNTTALFSVPALQSLAEFQAVLDAQDKQAVPIKQVGTRQARLAAGASIGAGSRRRARLHVWSVAAGQRLAIRGAAAATSNRGARQLSLAVLQATSILVLLFILPTSCIPT